MRWPRGSLLKYTEWVGGEQLRQKQLQTKATAILILQTKRSTENLSMPFKSAQRSRPSISDIQRNQKLQSIKWTLQPCNHRSTDQPVARASPHFISLRVATDEPLSTHNWNSINCDCCDCPTMACNNFVIIYIMRNQLQRQTCAYREPLNYPYSLDNN